MINSISVMHDRSNGLGGGFAGYGIYPHYKDFYAFHLFYDGKSAQAETEAFLGRHFEIAYSSEIQTRKIPTVTDEPLIWRYFVTPLSRKLADSHLDEREYVVRCANRINVRIAGAYVFSCGKNMGIFKGVGFPEDIGRFYRLEEYSGYAWTCHGRYPTNTPGWWGGAHPFGLLDFFHRPQRGDFLLRRQPPLHRDVRLQMHAGRRIPKSSLISLTISCASAGSPCRKRRTSLPRRSGRPLQTRTRTPANRKRCG